MFEGYRYISGRSLLVLEKLDRCQDLPEETWTSFDRLWHVVFISHRWGSQDDPDPMGSQLVALQRLVRRMVDLRLALEDERVSVEAVRDRLAIVPSLARQGSLQAAHLLFRTLCDGQTFGAQESDRLAGEGFLDVIGFWYDFSCLPQEPRVAAEELEFRRTLCGIGEMILSARVSTLVLRREEDGYLERGWCFAESMIAGAKEDVFKPMILRTDRWDEGLTMPLLGAFGALRPQLMEALRLWEDGVSPVAAGMAFERGVNGTAVLMLAKMDDSMEEFVMAATAMTIAGLGLFAGLQSRVALLPVGGRVDLAGELVNALRAEGLGCRDDRDYVLVALLLMKSLMAGDAVGDLGIFGDALGRLTGGLGLLVERREEGLAWQG